MKPPNIFINFKNVIHLICNHYNSDIDFKIYHFYVMFIQGAAGSRGPPGVAGPAVSHQLKIFFGCSIYFKHCLMT